VSTACRAPGHESPHDFSRNAGFPLAWLNELAVPAVTRTAETLAGTGVL
jgi:hypothetical protein